MTAIEKLKKVSTATLTTVLFKRGFRNVFIQGVFLLNRDAPRMAGAAYTLRYIPARVHDHRAARLAGVLRRALRAAEPRAPPRGRGERADRLRRRRGLPGRHRGRRR